MLKRCAKRGGYKILLGWNRGLGDIALGLYAMVHRIREYIPHAEITFLIRENLKDGFSLLEGVNTIVAPNWKRGEAVDVKRTLLELKIDPKRFDLIISRPSPTDWVPWQRGKIVPKLKWNPECDSLHEKFDLPQGFTYIGVQVVAETSYGLWRNWPMVRWNELFQSLLSREKIKILLFGFGDEPKFSFPNIIDLRGKTSFFELLSIIKNRCQFLILPDSGISSMTYYLDVQFPIHLISLWADPDHGILKQRVPSPNSLLVHTPLIGENRDLLSVSMESVLQRLFPVEPLESCPRVDEVAIQPNLKAGCIILAGGQGTRFGTSGPKGLFTIYNKTLFQWICEKAPKDLPIAIMTSPLNHQETVAYFERNRFFGLDIHFFTQEMGPLLDEEKRPIEIRPGEIVQGPNGNGSIFRSFARSGLAAYFASKGIEIVSIVPVDNPLAHPFDPAFIAYAHETKADAVVKCIERRPDEMTLGVIGKKADRIEVVEYTEIPSEEMKRYRFANTGLLALRLSFMKKMGEIDLPVHWVQKKMQIGSGMISVWKGERFIFDAFPYATRVEALLAPRESCYASLKTRESLQEVEKILEVR